MTWATENKYREWIEKRVPTFSKAYGACAQVTLEMQQAFPELRRVCGWYHSPLWGSRPHWWLETPDQKIVDPTVKQFPTPSLGVYEELIPGVDPIPSGRCADCGKTVYDGATFCNEECRARTTNYLNG